MKNFFTRKWLFALVLLSVVSMSFITDSKTSNLTSLTNQVDEIRAINFCPAYPGLINQKNPDGTSVSFFLKGDEVLHWQVTPEGYTILQNEKGYYCYAMLDAKGNLIPSTTVATDAKSKSTLTFSKNLTFSKSQIKEALQTRDELFHPAIKVTGSKAKGFLTGDRKVLVLLIDFKDRPFAHSRQEYDNMMNQLNYNGTGSFKDYYKAVSYNQLNCLTDVKGPYHANGTMAKYGANINGNKYTNAKLLVQEAVDAAEADGVNFADYDNNGDGYVDAVIVVHSNNDEAQGAGSNAIWSHQSALRYGGYDRTYDGVKIDLYNIDPGVTGATGNAMGSIGVFCHEFGHALGLPDTYDIDYSGALTPGNWDVMDAGSYNNNSQTPAYHNPWARTKLGWQAPVVKKDPETGLTLADCSTNKDLFRVNTQTKGEYYILENRQQTGFNTFVYGHGLLIWRIDSTFISSAGNGVNTNPAHQGVALVRANNAAANNAGNTFPGTSSVTSFTDETTPSMKAYDGQRVYKPITNIQETTGTISFDFVQGLPATDIGVVAVINPKSGALVSGGVNVTAKIKNFGSATVSGFAMTYTLDTETPQIETCPSSIAPGQEIEFTFTEKVTLALGNHSILVATASIDDPVFDNNGITKPITISSSVPIPFSEDFEGATFPPTDWTVVNPDAPLGVWVQKNTAIGINGTITKTAFIDYWNYPGTTDDLITPSINLVGTTSPVLTFNYAYHKTNADGLAIRVSSDFGANYTEVWKKIGVDLATVAGDGSAGDPLNDFTPTAANQWKTITIDLSAYVGKEIKISFTGISANGDNIWIDDVKVAEGTSCVAPTSAKNFSATSITKSSATINWERGNGTGVVVLQRIGESVDGIPVNGTLYAVGEMIGESKVIYVGSATTQNLTGLTAATEYDYAIYEVSSTKCYSVNPLEGSFTTPGLATVNTLTIRDLQATSATVVGSVTSIGEAPVTERGVCYSIDYNKLDVDYDHVVCQSGIGEFGAALTNLNPGSPYYAVAYAKNLYGVAYGKIMSFYTSGGCDYLNYLPSGVQKGILGYTDLGTNGTEIALDNTDNANSLPIDIGFNFKFNCLTFDKFILNTNGFIKLGTVNPSKPDLFQAPVSYGVDQGLFSTDYRDQYLISPFQYDLIGTATASYKVFTTGAAPNRITTIQFKNLKDNIYTGAEPTTVTPVQYSTIEFQITLYETTNVIDFAYGTFVTSGNAVQYRYGQVGIKGGGYAVENQITINKGSGTAWNGAVGIGNFGNTGTFSCKNTVLPTAGQVYRFNPIPEALTKDISVADVYTLTNVPANAGMPQSVSADIKNTGVDDMTNITVNLEVTGTNTYTATPIVIPSLSAGSTKRVTFPAFITNTLGAANAVKVFVSATGDLNAANDSKTVTQTVSTNTYSYTVGSTPTTAYNAAGVAAVKYHVSGTRIIKTVTAFIYNTAANSGKSTKAYVYDASGVKIGESAPVTVTLGVWNTFAITTPPTVTSSDFYVGIDVTPVTTNYWLAAVQSINSLNTGVNVIIPTAGGTPVDFGNLYRFMITAVIDVPTVTAEPVVVTSSEVTHPTNTDAVVSGNVTDDKGAPITERGFYWSTATPVTIADTKVTATTNGVGSYSATIAGLTPGTTYYVESFATNSVGATLGNEISFIKKGSQTITFGSLTAMEYQEADVALTATASSTLPVSYVSDNTSVATIVETPASSGNFFIHVVGVGACNIKASQAGDAAYGAAVDVVQPLTVNKKAITVTIPDLTRVFNYSSQVVVPTPAEYKYKITYNGSLYPPVDAASYTVVATIDETNFQGTATETLVVNKVDAVITFNPIPTKKLTDVDFLPDVVSSSGLEVTLASGTTGVATIVGGMIHIVGGGTSSITASSLGNANFNAPTSKFQVLTVDNVKPVITLVGDAVVNISFGTAFVDAGATATDNVDGNITSSIVVTGKPTITSPVGAYTVRYNVSDAMGNAATEVTRTVNVTPGVGIDPNETYNVKIYSNSTTVFVQIPEIKGTAKLSIYNILGNQVYMNNNLTQGLNRIDKNLIAGTYIVKVVIGNEVKTEKVVIQK